MKTNLLYTIYTILLCCQLGVTWAQFGIKKKIPDKILSQDQGAEAGAVDGAVDAGDLLNFDGDLELEEAIQAFADMSREEMVETIQEMKDLLHDDPDALKELDVVIEELSKMDEQEIQDNLEAIMAEEAVAQSMAETLEMLQNADESTFEKILEKKDTILQTIVESGIMSKEELAMFENDEAAWEEELRFIWNELKTQASAASTMDTSTLLDGEL